MKILGMVKASFIDYPKKASTVLFIGGCNFRCSYCHNPDIVHGRGDEIDIEELFAFLHKRKKYLDAVVITGGEPTMHDELIGLARRIKEMGYAIKLDTNGTRPAMIKTLIDDMLLDYIAMDIKAPYEKYPEVTCVSSEGAADPAAIKESIELIKNSGLDYEFRTTICRELLVEADIISMMEMIKGAKKYCLQRYKNLGKVLGEGTLHSAYSEGEMKALGAMAAEYVGEVIVR